jgi:hypothetical protein
MIRLTDITFYANNEYADTDQLLDRQRPALLYIEGLQGKLQVDLVKHITGNTTRIIERENIHFFRSKNKPGFISGETIGYLKKNRPDIVFVHGLIFPLHIIRLAMILGRKVKIVVWHHADKPRGRIKKYFSDWLTGISAGIFLPLREMRRNGWRLVLLQAVKK